MRNMQKTEKPASAVQPGTGEAMCRSLFVGRFLLALKVHNRLSKNRNLLAELESVVANVLDGLLRLANDSSVQSSG